MTVYKKNHIVAVIHPNKKDITSAFSRGLEFEDKCGLFHSIGRVSN